MRILNRLAAASLLALFTTSCATDVTSRLFVTGGSRADGTVVVSYTYSTFETPTYDEVVATDLATKKCRAWGYEGAEAFGGIEAVPHPGDYTYRRNIPYQCLGDLER